MRLPVGGRCSAEGALLAAIVCASVCVARHSATDLSISLGGARRRRRKEPCRRATVGGNRSASSLWGARGAPITVASRQNGRQNKQHAPGQSDVAVWQSTFRLLAGAKLAPDAPQGELEVGHPASQLASGLSSQLARHSVKHPALLPQGWPGGVWAGEFANQVAARWNQLSRRRVAGQQFIMPPARCWPPATLGQFSARSTWAPQRLSGPLQPGGLTGKTGWTRKTGWTG